jgi:kynureninase
MDRGFAARLDASDPLAFARDRFELADGIVYLDGNSLGAMPRSVPGALSDAMHRQWAADLITSWNANGWWELPGRIGDRIAAMIGAGEGQVICGDSTSVQLFQLLTAACRLRPGRSVLITDGNSFPTDQYLADAVGRMLGLTVVRVHPNNLGEYLTEDVAAVAFSMVDYRTGELFDAAGITAAVHDSGALMLWDLCHAVGALPVALDDLGSDFAVGCTYKYLNGGPGSPAFAYIAARHLTNADLPLTGWHGHRAPFDLEQQFEPSATIERARIGTPPLLSMLALDAALDAFGGVDMAAIRTKSLALTDLVIMYADSELAGCEVSVVTPRAHERRGSQVALRMPHAYEVCQALIARGVIGDFRAPDLLRLGFAPLYLRYADVWDALVALRAVLTEGEFRRPEFAVRSAVT